MRSAPEGNPTKKEGHKDAGCMQIKTCLRIRLYVYHILHFSAGQRGFRCRTSSRKRHVLSNPIKSHRRLSHSRRRLPPIDSKNLGTLFLLVFACFCLILLRGHWLRSNPFSIVSCYISLFSSSSSPSSHRFRKNRPLFCPLLFTRLSIC